MKRSHLRLGEIGVPLRAAAYAIFFFRADELATRRAGDLQGRWSRTGPAKVSGSRIYILEDGGEIK